MNRKPEVTLTVRRLMNGIRRLPGGCLPPGEQITPMQGRVIGYLIRHSDQDVFQRDLEQEFQIRRSTASAIVQGMERNGLIRREAVAQDARLKKLLLTPRAEAFNERFLRAMEEVEAVITRGVTREELEAFFSVTAKFEQNLKDDASARDSAKGRDAAERRRHD